MPVASNDTAAAAAVTTKKLEALDAASGVVPTDSASLTMFADVATSLLESEPGGTASAAVAEQASGALDNVLSAALDSGLDAGAGTSLLKATTSVGNSFASTPSTDSAVAKGARASKLRVLFSKLGSALISSLQEGAASTISTVDGGKGTEVTVAKESASKAAEDGFAADGVQISGSALALRRRLQECTTLAVQKTNFVASNPFNYLVTGLGQNAYVANDASVSTLEIKQCNVPLVRPNLDPPIALQLPLNAAPGTLPEGYTWSPVCVRLDETSELLPNQEWTTNSMTWLLPATYDGKTLECSAGIGGGSYAAAFVPLKLEVTSTETSTTSTRTMVTTLMTMPSELIVTDGGMVFGVALAGIALVVVVGAIAVQCYIGNVKVQKPKMSDGFLQRLNEAMTLSRWSRSAKVGIEPGPTEPNQAWSEQGLRETARTDEKQARQDAQDHFWDWANDLIKSTSDQTAPHLPSSGSFSGPKAASPPALPARFAMRRPSAEKEEYFEHFAQELREIVSAGIPGMIAEAQPGILPPSPPPKRSVQAAPPRPPPTPPRRRMSRMSELSTPPALENAAPLAVRVDQSFSDWATDFASITEARSRPSSPPPPPPPPPRPMLGNPLPLPPAIVDRGPLQLKAPPPKTKGDPSGSWALRSLAKAPPIPGTANVGNLPLPPPSPPQSNSQLSILSPPSFLGSQLSKGVPKHQPLVPPLPKGPSVKSTLSAKGAPPFQLPGMVNSGEGSQTPRENT